MQSFLVALAFLTIIPIRFSKLPGEETVARSRFWFPAVGLLLGALLGGLTYAAAQFTSPTIGAFLVLAAWVISTGALHLDGFCDVCDGLFGGATPDDRLRIMKDSRVGTFAVVGVVLLLLGKFSALHELLSRPPLLAAPFAVAMSVLVARCLVLTVAVGAHYPRDQGTGKSIIEATRNLEAILFSIVAVGAVGSFLCTLPRVSDYFDDSCKTDFGTYVAARSDLFGRAILFFVLAWMVVISLRKLCERRLGGITGDCLGAVIEMTEAVFLLAAALLVGSG
jgi:cobalamin 5'-phosphate synthase/cobalamin synthase